MKVIKNCFTRNNLTTLFCSAFFCFSSVLLPSLSAFAAPAVVPVAGEALYALLVALGLIAGNASSEYVWTGNDNPYVDSIFEAQVSGITSGIPISTDMLEQLDGTVIPKGVYETDGSKFYIGGNEMTQSQLFVTAQSVAGVDYKFPTNVVGIEPAVRFGRSANGRPYAYCNTPAGLVESDSYFFPYFITSGGSYLSPCAIKFLSDTKPINTIGYVFNNGQYISYTSSTSALEKYLYFPVENGNSRYSTSNSETFGYAYPIFMPVNSSNTEYGFGFLSLSGSAAYNFDTITSCALMRTSGLPKTDVAGQKDLLVDAIVEVKPPEDDDDPKTPPDPVPPQKWQIWKDLKDFLVFVDGGDSNGGTDYGQYVNNNYNYVQVDINVPDEVNTNVNIGGSLGIDGKGDINVTIHEDVSLPVGDDGSSFFTPDAADVVDGLANNNPVISVISALFSAIDPKILGIFTSSISLLLILGLWKLIRG